MSQRPHANAAPNDGVPLSKDVGAPPPLPATMKDAPEWMENKGTLRYLHNTFKLGKLSEVIAHWYELERLLGFRKAVSTLYFSEVYSLLTIFRPRQVFR